MYCLAFYKESLLLAALDSPPTIRLAVGQSPLLPALSFPLCTMGRRLFRQRTAVRTPGFTVCHCVTWLSPAHSPFIFSLSGTKHLQILRQAQGWPDTQDLPSRDTYPGVWRPTIQPGVDTEEGQGTWSGVQRRPPGE